MVVEVHCASGNGFNSHICGFRFGGSGYSFDWTGFFNFCLSFQFFCVSVYALGFGLGIGECFLCINQNN